MYLLINREGSVEDIRCSLSYYKKGCRLIIPDIEASIEDEKRHQNRSTVIKMLEAKLKNLQNNE